MSKQDYNTIAKRMMDIKYMSNAVSILHWDSKTYMPPKGISQRGAQISILSRNIHELFVKPENGRLLDSCIKKSDELSEVENRNVELWKRDYDKATKLPSDLVQKLSNQQVLTENLWEEAKERSEYGLVKPEIKKLIELTKEKADRLNPEQNQYDTLIDIYEPKVTAEQITKYFTPLKEAVIKLVKKCEGQCDRDIMGIDPDMLSVECTQQQQQKLANFLMEFIGLNPEKSRLDTSEHPFTTGYANDVRITTHYLENDPMGSFYSVLHEAGHAIYELNLPQEHLWTPVGDTVSLGIHESQSRFIENIVGKNPTFIEYYYPKVLDMIPGFRKKSVSIEQFVRAINFVRPSKIRIYSDEVTYNLHIILRFEIERDLFAGKITVDDLPQVWNEKMDEYLFQEIEEDREGVLQDTHWYGGAFGYFPTYSLGNIYGGQMLHAMQEQIPSWKQMIARGDFQIIRNWLIENVHQKGSLYDPSDLIENISGERPKPQYFIDYMNHKYDKIYGF